MITGTVTAKPGQFTTAPVTSKAEYTSEIKTFEADYYGGVLSDKVTKTPAGVSISGVRYGVVNSVVTSFAVNQAPIEDKGLRGCPAFTQYFLNNQTPVTQSITLAARSYCLWVEGTGLATFNGLTATAGNPKVFTLASSFTGDCTITGSLTKVMLNSGGFPAPFTPTFGTIVSVVSEAATSTTGTSFDLDAATLSRLKTGLRGPNTQGHFELEVESNVDSGWLPSGINTSIPLLSANNNGPAVLLFLRKESGGLLRFSSYDGSLSVTVYIDTLTVGQTFRISLDYGTYTDGTQKKRLTVNGVKSSVVDFSGSFGTQDLRFFYDNNVHFGWIKDLKYYGRPRW